MYEHGLGIVINGLSVPKIMLIQLRWSILSNPRMIGIQDTHT